MTLDSILILATAIAALTLKPGPGMMLEISHTISNGMKGCFAVLLGAQLVNLVFIGLVFLGFNALNLDMVFISILVKSLAAVYLVWMGIQGLKETEVAVALDDFEGKGFYDAMTSSMMLTASNPLVIIFYAGIFPTILDIDALLFVDVVTVICVIIFVEAGIATLLCLPFAFFRYKISPPILQKMRITSSIIIIIIGLYIGYTAIPATDILSVF